MQNGNVMSWNDALSKYRLNFDVQKIPLQFFDSTGKVQQAPNLFGMQRQDNMEILPGVAVNKSYEIIQNSSYADIGNRVTDGLDAEFYRGGTLKNGSLMFLQAKLPGHIRVRGSDDVIEKYITFINSFDGSSSFRSLITAVRLFCANQLPNLLSQARRNGLSIRHTKNAHDRLLQADHMVLQASNAFKAFEQKVDWLVDQKVTDKQAEIVARRMFGVEDNALDADVPTRTKNRIAKVMEVFQTAEDLKMWRGTGWALHNSLSAFHNHHSSLRSTTDRFESNLVGSGALAMQKGFAALDEVLNA